MAFVSACDKGEDERRAKTLGCKFSEYCEAWIQCTRVSLRVYLGWWMFFCL